MSNLESATTTELLSQLDSSDRQTLVEAAKELAFRQEKSAASRMLAILRSTNDSIIRNAVAIALSDLKEQRAFDLLIELLQDERTRSNRGTLLYALGAYDGAPVLPKLVEFVISGNFESSRQALSLIAGIENEIDKQVWHDAVERTKEALKSASEERRPLLLKLLSLFEQGL